MAETLPFELTETMYDSILSGTRGSFKKTFAQSFNIRTLSGSHALEF